MGHLHTWFFYNSKFWDKFIVTTPARTNMKWTVPKKGAMNDLCGEGALVRELKQLLSALLPNTASTCCTANERSNTLFGIEEGRKGVHFVGSH